SRAAKRFKYSSKVGGMAVGARTTTQPWRLRIILSRVTTIDLIFFTKDPLLLLFAKLPTSILGKKTYIMGFSYPCQSIVNIDAIVPHPILVIMLHLPSASQVHLNYDILPVGFYFWFGLSRAVMLPSLSSLDLMLSARIPG